MGSLEAKLHEARDACAAQRAEAASLRVQIEQLKVSLEAATRREADAEQQARLAEERASRWLKLWT